MKNICWFCMILGACAGFTICNLIFRPWRIVELRQEAIDHGYAEHNSRNGVWQWKEPIEVAEGFARNIGGYVYMPTNRVQIVTNKVYQLNQ